MLFLLRRLRKSQMGFDWDKPAEQKETPTPPHHKAYDRTMPSGKVVHVEAKGPQHPDREQLAHGQQIMYRAPEMPRRRKGTITGSSDAGWHVTGQRQGHILKPSEHVLPREQIWTIGEHEADRAPKGTHIATSTNGRVLKPEIVRERAEKGYARLGISEGEVLTHPEILRVTKNSLNRLAATNRQVMEPGFRIENGTIYNDSPESMDAYDAFSEKLLESLRRQTANAPDEMLDEFRDHLQGKRDNSRIFWTGIQDGETAALRYVKKRKEEHQTHDEYNTGAEGDFEAGMRDISAQTATAHHQDSELKRKADRDQAIEGALAEMHPKAAELLRRHFGLGDYLEPQSTAAMAREMGTTKEKVDRVLTLALQAFAATKGSRALRDFLKSMREEIDLRKSLPFEEALVKSHIRQYTRMDGTVVTEHQDKRVKKHPDILAHENTHGEKIHSGADLKHDLAGHLRSRGWKEREATSVRPKEGAKAGKKEDMPEPSKIKGANQENSALQSAQRTIQKMHDAVKNGSDPVASLQTINTSRANPYLAAVDDEKKRLLEHFGHEQTDEKHQKFDKDGHTVILSQDGKKVHFAGGDLEAKGDKPVGALAGKKNVETTDTGKKDPKFILGRENKAYTAKMNEVNSHYALVEAGSLTASHSIQGHVNKAYPQEIQPRERERASSQMQMANIMNDLKPELFGHSATASDGAPIVGKDGAVESGNGRTIALSAAYDRGLASKYKTWLKGEAEHFGLKPEDVEKMDAPMLVRVRGPEDGNKDRAEFAREANQSSNLGSSPAEQAWTDADRIDDSLLKKFEVDEDGEIFNDENMPFINGFLDKLGKNEAASLRDSDGEPNKKCIERIQNAVFAKVYGSSVLAEFQSESAKPRIRNVLKALNACVGDFAQVKGHDDLDVVPDMMEAIEYTLSHGNVSKQELEHTLKNAGALNFTGDTPTFKTDFAVSMILAVADRTGNRNRLQNVFKAISNEIKTEVASRENPEVDMFSGPAAPKTKEQVVKTALGKVDRAEMNKSVRSGVFLLRKAHSAAPGGTHGIGRRKVSAQVGTAQTGILGCRQDGQRGREEGGSREAQGHHSSSAEAESRSRTEREGRQEGGAGRGAGDRLSKAHIAAYNRTTHSGALVQVLAHEDSRVSGYGAKLSDVKNHRDLHKLRTERFGHLPHWGKLDDRTKGHILNAEDHIGRQVKAQETPEKPEPAPHHVPVDTIDRSGWGQARLFKARAGIWMLRKSQLGLFGAHHVEYTRRNKSGTISRISAKGAQRHEDAKQPELDFTAPAPVVKKPSGPSFITEGTLRKHPMWSEVGYKDLKRGHYNNLQIKAIWDKDLADGKPKPNVAPVADHKIFMEKGKEIYNRVRTTVTAGAQAEGPISTNAYLRERQQRQDEANYGKLIQAGIIAEFDRGEDAGCGAHSRKVGVTLTAMQKNALTDFYRITGTGATESLQTTVERAARARANPFTKSIDVSQFSPNKTVQHEAAHHLEFSDYNLQIAANSFRNYKAEKSGNREVEQLNKIMNSTAYDGDEMALRDNFVHPYIGKVYQNRYAGYTEVLSMGMQHILDPAAFTELETKDPEHLHFMVGMLQYLKEKEAFKAQQKPKESAGDRANRLAQKRKTA